MGTLPTAAMLLVYCYTEPTLNKDFTSIVIYEIPPPNNCWIP